VRTIMAVALAVSIILLTGCHEQSPPGQMLSSPPLTKQQSNPSSAPPHGFPSKPLWAWEGGATRRDALHHLSARLPRRALVHWLPLQRPRHDSDWCLLAPCEPRFHLAMRWAGKI